MRRLQIRPWDALVAQLNRTARLNEQPFDLSTPVHTQRGRWGMVHYGVMVPGLPEPFRFLDLIVVLGTARAPIFDNHALVRTTPEDSAWLLVGSAVTADSFRPYSVAAGECDLAEDGSRLRFGSDATLSRSGRKVTVRAAQPGVRIRMTIRLTPAVSHFAHMPGLYDHWSVLGDYSGTFAVDGATLEHSGLCTYEYARAVNLPLPFVFFTYQILDIGDATQVLMTEVLGPRGLPVQRAVYLRERDGRAAVFTRGFHHRVHEYAPMPLVTPDGHRMRMPARFGWRVEDDHGEELIAIDGTTNDDFVYGLGAGYAGSYAYTGHLRGAPIHGTAYLEWIDRR